jgi:hypothetical protein
VDRSGVQRVAAEPLQAVADPVAAELEAALELRRAGADPKALRRALRRIEELLDEQPLAVVVAELVLAAGGAGQRTRGGRGGVDLVVAELVVAALHEVARQAGADARLEVVAARAELRDVGRVAVTSPSC